MDTEDPRGYSAPITGQNWKRTVDDHNRLMGAASRYEKAAPDAVSTDERWQIVPTPLMLEVLGHPSVDAFCVYVNDAAGALPHGDTAALLRADLVTAGASVAEEQSEASCTLHISTGVVDSYAQVSGGYTLRVEPGCATVVGHDQAGALYGAQSFLTLLGRAEGSRLPVLQMVDAPRLPVRAVQIDVARHFRSPGQIIKLLAQMSRYKLNKLHLSLTNDEGWRLEIPQLPELTTVGGRRCHSDSSDISERTALLPQLGSGPTQNSAGSSGFYSVEEYTEIVHAARVRGIEVIPELNMPAHARAAVVSMEARYHNCMDRGDAAGAAEFRLLDPDDTSQCTENCNINAKSSIFY